MIKFKLICRWLRYNVVLRLLSFLPSPIAYQAVRMIGLFDSFVNGKDRLAYVQGLANAFPALSSAELDNCWQAHRVMMAREQLDVLFIPKISSLNCERLITLHGLEVLQEAQQEGRGVVLAMGHYGRPIMLSTQLAVYGSKIGMLSQTIDERNPHLNPVERSYLARKMKIVTEAAGGRWLMLDDSMRPLYEGVKSGETIILMFDLHEPKPTNRLEVPFCNGVMGLPRGIERVAAATGARVVYGVAKDDGRKVVVELRKLPQDPHQALVAAVKELEKDVKTAPWQWWQWPLFDHAWSSSLKDG